LLIVSQQFAKPGPQNNDILKSKSWLQRLLSSDPRQPRKNARQMVSGLAAYFWTGATPRPHTIRDISPTGLYVVTEERWYPGTLIQMTLQKIGTGRPKTDLSIALMARALRWGNDGVGLEFVVQSRPNHRNGDAIHAEGATREKLDRFFELIKEN